MRKLIIIALLLMLATVMFVFAQSQDDDTVLEFHWIAARGSVTLYNVYVAIVDVPTDPIDITNYTIVGAYLVTDQYASPPSTVPYPLPLVGQHGKIYYVIVNAEDTAGTDLLTLTLDFEDDLDSGSVTLELLQEFVNAGVPLSMGATTQVTLRDRYLFSDPDGNIYATDLDNNVLPDGLKQAFAAEGHILSVNATVSVTAYGNRWEVIDSKVTYDIRANITTGWLNIYGAPKQKFWAIVDVAGQKTYPVMKGDDDIIYVTDGNVGPNSAPSDYVWCLLTQQFVPGQPKQTKGFGE